MATLRMLPLLLAAALPPAAKIEAARRPAAEAAAGWEGTPLKVFVLAGQSNMEGQAEVVSSFGKACPEQLPGMVPVCCSAKNVSGCCPDRADRASRGATLRCVPHQQPQPPNTTMDPCPHDPVQGPTNDACYKNGTLRYQTLDPRTRAEFAQCRDNASDSWRILEEIKVRPLGIIFGVLNEQEIRISPWCFILLQNS